MKRDKPSQGERAFGDVRVRKYHDVRKLNWRGQGPSKKYYVRVVEPDGRTTWKNTGFTDLEAAEAIVKRWQADAIAGVEPTNLPPALLVAFRRWQRDALIGRSWRYQEIVERVVQRAIRTVGVNFGVADLSESVIADFTRSCVAAGYAPSTINLYLTILSIALNYFVKQKWIERNFVVRAFYVPQEEKQPRIITPEEEARLLAIAAEHPDPRHYGYVLLLLATGFRSGLAGRVRWEHVDLIAGMWRIPAKLMKSRREYVQPIAPRILDWLRTHAKPSGHIFGPGADKWWGPIRERAGLPTLKQHDLRRTFVTKCRRAGVTLEATMALSDHHDLRTMTQFYRRVDETDTREALERIEKKPEEKKAETKKKEPTDAHASRSSRMVTRFPADQSTKPGVFLN